MTPEQWWSAVMAAGLVTSAVVLAVAVRRADRRGHRWRR